MNSKLILRFKKHLKTVKKEYGMFASLLIAAVLGIMLALLLYRRAFHLLVKWQVITLKEKLEKSVDLIEKERKQKKAKDKEKRFNEEKYFPRSLHLVPDRAKDQVKMAVDEICKRVHFFNTMKVEQIQKLFKSEDMHYLVVGDNKRELERTVDEIVSGVNKRLNQMKKFRDEDKDLDKVKWDDDSISNDEVMVSKVTIGLFDITGIYFGEAEENIKRLFSQMLEEKDPYNASITVFSECQMIFKKRIEGENSSGLIGSILAEVLGQFNRLNEKPGPIFMIAWTTLPRYVDSAIKRRFFNLITV
ncbi:hypothetical protein ECANGB1_232 [Enterospora canceri]|uniref:ATPase AAA-type core domain-containing protein n=1 Tax=Enterospora canceri TaxID=1081671 RepID=A0A1Y1S8Z6_9MICR|nr:hypothetical protein ECANGB1_232 [Enterospora canceri]